MAARSCHLARMSTRDRRDIPSSGSWRHSLYARAALFLVLGCGSLMGAMITLSYVIVGDSVDQLLQERHDHASMLGVLLEDWLRTDMEHLATHVPIVDRGTPRVRLGPLPVTRGFLGHEDANHAFREGVFLAGPDGQVLYAAPEDAAQVARMPEMKALFVEAAGPDGMAASNLLRPGASDRHVMVILRPIRAGDGRLLAFVGGLLQPATTNLLDVFAGTRKGHRTVIDLLDRKGVVVASTRRERVFVSSDHAGLLSNAIRARQGSQGRCHSCHVDASDRVTPDPEVLAFAPLPHLRLGVAVHQPEEAALAPAFALQKRLFTLGLSFLALFVLFAGLSVRSVVRPVKRLTRAVGSLETTDRDVRLPSFGHGEVGALAATLERWRDRTLDSMAAIESHRQALRREMEHTRRHLVALQKITVKCSIDADMSEIVEEGASRLAEVLGLGICALRVTGPDGQAQAALGMAPGRVGPLIERLRRATNGHHDTAAQRLDQGLVITDVSHMGVVTQQGTAGTLLIAILKTTHETETVALLGDLAPGVEIQDRWVRSLMHQLGMAATNRLLRDEQRRREAQRQRFLHKVLTAQEDERRRIAREVHDTVAQDLAALRLHVERLADDAEVGSLRERLLQLEKLAASTLATVRRILLDLRPSALEDMGFLPAMSWRLERMAQERGIRGTLSVDGDERPLDVDLSVTLYRIFQEAAQNAVQHGKAEHVFVTISFHEDSVEMSIEDDGVGFDVSDARRDAAKRTGRGFGLLGMMERAELLGGKLQVSSRPDEGTTVTVHAPTLSGLEGGEPARTDAAGAQTEADGGAGRGRTGHQDTPIGGEDPDTPHPRRLEPGADEVAPDTPTSAQAGEDER